MKFYETHYEEYIHSIEQYNIHPEMIDTYNRFPKTLAQFGNVIMYGPPGSGKYSQVLYFLKKYSPSELKYDKKITDLYLVKLHPDNEEKTYELIKLPDLSKDIVHLFQQRIDEIRNLY